MAIHTGRRGLFLLPAALLQLALGLRAASEHSPPPASTKTHAFYYLWYGNPDTDGKYLHWNHEILPHWNEATRARFEHGTRFDPPDDVHSPYYPRRGPYSSSDPALLRSHMEELLAAGVGVMVISWWGPAHREGTADTQGVQTDHVLPRVVEAAEATGMLLAFHLEPYPGRSHLTVKEDVEYLMERYRGSHALYRIDGRPVYYVYDSYHVQAADWAQVIGRGTPKGGPARTKGSLRGGENDGFFIGLWLGAGSGQELFGGGFEGFYTYFASSEVSHGADPRNWPQLAQFAATNGMTFVASVGPGYNDTRIRPWNAAATRGREGGARYERMWKRAIDSGASFVSITSYNEWGEGTQIEAAVSHTNPKGEVYPDYGGDPDRYMRLTQQWAW